MQLTILDNKTLAHEIECAEAESCRPRLFSMPCEVFNGMASELLAWRRAFPTARYNEATNSVEIPK